MSIILISLCACIFTVLGGLFALRFKDKLHLIIGFSAGAILGVAFFDLIPEAIILSGDVFGVARVISVVALGYLVYLLADRFVISHNHKTGEYCECEEEIELDDDVLEEYNNQDCCCGHDHDVSDSHDDHLDEEENEGEHDNNRSAHEKRKGMLGALSLSVHSFIDGISIGIAFQVSQAVGIIVTIAVLIHDFSDGLNTVNMILKNNGKRKEALKWLAIDAIAPVLGVLSTLFFTIPKSTLGLILAMFAGFFIYIASSNMIPESHHEHSTKWTTVMTVLGMVVLYTAINLAGM
ncbi:MAG: ZIP family metal transporter [bacterium]